MNYEIAKKIMNKHEVTLKDQIEGVIFYPGAIIFWYRIARREGVSFYQATKDYFKILFRK